jgi:hypothetical protein
VLLIILSGLSWATTLEGLILVLNGMAFIVQFGNLWCYLLTGNQRGAIWCGLSNFFVPINLTILLLFLRWGTQVAQLSFGKVQNWQAMLFSKMIMLNQWNFYPIYRHAPGLLRTFMHHVLRKGKLISSTGSIILICPRINFGLLLEILI